MTNSHIPKNKIDSLMSEIQDVVSLKDDNQVVKNEKESLLKEFDLEEKETPTEKVSPKTVSPKVVTAKKGFFRGHKKLWAGVFILFLFFFVVVGGVALAGFSVYLASKPVADNAIKTLWSSQQAINSLKEQNLVEAETHLKASKEALINTRDAYQKLNWTKNVPIISTYNNDAQSGLNAAVAGVEAAEIALDAVTPYADVLGFTGKGSFTGGTVEDRIATMVETFDKVTPKLEEVSKKLDIAQTELDKIDPERYPETLKETFFGKLITGTGLEDRPIKSKIIELKLFVSTAHQFLAEARPLVEKFPSILGYPKSKKYMILFQNDGELRPTGGFLSAFAILNIDKGRIGAEKSDDIYSLDKKFTKKVEPPAMIVKYLNEKVWHMRNMNTSPDFYQSMSTFKEAYDSLKDEYKVDGIVVINTHVLEKLVEVVGSLNVAGFGTFTTENDKRCNLPQVVCELEYIVDRPLNRIVENRKSAVLGPMMQELMKQTLGGGRERITKLMPLLLQLLEQKHMMVYFVDEETQKAAELGHFAGRIREYEGDYLHVNNANLGGAKSNFYIDDTVNQEVKIAEDGSVEKKIELVYNHTEPMDNCNLEAGELCLSGIQRNYFRIYVPLGSELIEGLGSEVDIKTNEELGKTYFDGFFELRPQTQAKIRITYKLPFKVAKGSEYKILIQKQASTKDSKYTISVNGKEDNFPLNKDLEKTYQW